MGGAVLFFESEVDDEVSALMSTDVVGPEDFEEIPGLSLSDIAEIDTDFQFVHKARKTGTVGICPSPGSGTVRLVGFNIECLPDGGREFIAALLFPALQGSEHYHVTGCGAESGGGFVR